MEAMSLVPAVAIIVTALAAHPAIPQRGSYKAGDPGTERVKSRKICSVPHSIVGLFFSQPNGITWQHYFFVVYAMIVGEGKQAVYHPLAIIFRQLRVGPATANVNAVRPSAPVYSRELTTRYMLVIEAMFPSLALGLATHTKTKIATALGALAPKTSSTTRRRRSQKRPRKPRRSWTGCGSSA